MNKILMTIISLVIPTLAVAEPCTEPKYLECTYERASEKHTDSIRIDENTGTITHEFDYGLIFKTKGTFTAKEIIYHQEESMGFQFTINRVNLDLGVEFFISGDLSPAGKGSCKIVKTEKNKI